MQNMGIELSLSAKHRIEEVPLPEGIKQIDMSVSRSKCKDVLLEIVSDNGQAKGKPLEKWLPQVKQKGLSKLRFMMNDFSTQPIDISIRWK